MTAASYDLVIEKGTDYSLELTWKDANGNPIDITGYDARMQIRHSLTSQDIILEATVTNGKIVLGGVSGQITVSFSNVETTAVTQLTGVYDLELVSPTNIVKRLIEGKVTFKAEVTR